MRALIALPLLLAGCAHEPVPVAKLDPPDEHLMMLCPELSDIPANDGNRDVRKMLYAEWRAAYAACRDRHAGLARYADTVAR